MAQFKLNSIEGAMPQRERQADPSHPDSQGGISKDSIGKKLLTEVHGKGCRPPPGRARGAPVPWQARGGQSLGTALSTAPSGPSGIKRWDYNNVETEKR